MRLHLFALVSACLQCSIADAQWSSFKPVTLDELPRDQRDIDQQTIVDKKVTRKEIRVDWYGFTLEGQSNVVRDRYQYPVADPTLAPGDRIVRVRTNDVDDAASINEALRASPIGIAVPISVERKINGKIETERITLYRGNSLILNDLLDGKLKARPPAPESDKPGSWGGVFAMSFRLVAIADDGEGVFRGSVYRTKTEQLQVENAVLRGWDVAGLAVGESIVLDWGERDNKPQTCEAAVQLLSKTGSSGVPGTKASGGDGFFFPRTTDTTRYVVGIGRNETVNVDGKKLKVSVLINME